MTRGTTSNKTLTIKDFVVDQDIDVMDIIETLLHEIGNDLINTELCPTGYKLIHTLRIENSGESVGLLYKDSIAVKHSHHRRLRSFEYLDISLEASQYDFDLPSIFIWNKWLVYQLIL